MSIISVAIDSFFAVSRMSDFSRFDNHLNENRQVRIFLSSTFSDMQKERME